MKKWIQLLAIVTIVNCFASDWEKASFVVRDYTHLYKMKGFDKNLLSMHFQLYAGYVKNTNKIMQDLEVLNQQRNTRTLEYGALKRMLSWEYDGMRLHELYFDNLGGNGEIKSKSGLYKQLTIDFGSFENWKQDFIATGMIKGIGWAILYYDHHTKKMVNAWINEHDLGHLSGNEPILVMDVFEHAYITQYGLNREEYIKAFFANIDWDECGERFEQANTVPYIMKASTP